MSPREEATNKIYDACSEFDLFQVYGGDTGYSDDKKYRFILICRSCNLDGTIRVYSPKYIMVQCKTRYKNLPFGTFTKVFKSADETIAFLKAAFVDYKDVEDDEEINHV